MNYWQKCRVLITGGGGFLAANLGYRLVNEGAEVHALIRPRTRLWRLSAILENLHLHPISLTNFSRLTKLLQQIQPQIIFHLAASGVHHRPMNEKTILYNNVIGTMNLLQALESFSWVRLVVTGGSSEYGKKNKPMLENDILEPVTFYGTTKAAATLLCQQFARSRQLPIVILRPFSIYGPWESANRLIPTTILAALNNRELALTNSGYRRDYVYVGDIAQACLLAAEKSVPQGEIINIGTGIQTSNETVVQLVKQITGRSIKILPGAFPARLSDTSFWAADTAKAKEYLGWTPTENLEGGLEKTISWFETNLSAYD